MDIKFVTRRHNRWSKKTIDYVKTNLTLKPHEADDSGMRRTLNNPRNYNYYLTLAKINNVVVGSSINFSYGGNFYEIHVYVNENFRRQKIGSKLLEISTKSALKRGAKHINIVPWNRRASLFYKDYYPVVLPSIKQKLGRKYL